MAFFHPPRVFCGSLCDVFDEEVPESWRDDLFELIYACKNLTWQILTKRPAKMRDYLLGTSGAGAANLDDGGIFDHVWWGISVEAQQGADERIPELLKIPARVRFLSCEPLLGPVNLGYTFSRIYRLSGGKAAADWVIVGGESGAEARPMHPGWARALRDQCAAAGVPFFFKQWGEWAPSKYYDAQTCRGRDGETAISINGTTPAMIHGPMVRVGKRAAGRLLDGREHNEFPKP